MEMEFSAALVPTKRFSVWSIVEKRSSSIRKYVLVNINCAYTASIIDKAVQNHGSTTQRILSLPSCSNESGSPIEIIQFCDFENISWEPVLDCPRGYRHRASSYVVRKGLSRKAQFSMQLKRYMAKNKVSILHSAVPFTLIIDTWEAFEDNMKIDFGRGFSVGFGATVISGIFRAKGSNSLRSRLDMCLQDTYDKMIAPERSDWTWILKPSVTNKGINIQIVRSWECLLNKLEESPDIREWVLQRYDR